MYVHNVIINRYSSMDQIENYFYLRHFLIQCYYFFFALTILLKFIYIEKILMNFNISYIVFGDQYHCRRKKNDFNLFDLYLNLVWLILNHRFVLVYVILIVQYQSFRFSSPSFSNMYKYIYRAKKSQAQFAFCTRITFQININ